MGQVVGPFPTNELVGSSSLCTDINSLGPYRSLGLPSNGPDGMDSLGVRLVSCKLLEHTPSSFIFCTTLERCFPSCTSSFPFHDHLNASQHTKGIKGKMLAETSIYLQWTWLSQIFYRSPIQIQQARFKAQPPDAVGEICWIFLAKCLPTRLKSWKVWNQHFKMSHVLVASCQTWG